MQYPVIDLFAGPGGLGEGFSAFENSDGNRVFRIGLSIEKDAHAHRTLELRSFFRQFPPDGIPDEYYCYLRGEVERGTLFRRFKKQAKVAQSEAWKAELGKVGTKAVNSRIKKAIGDRRLWVLVGGPPCQAYSTIGRARVRGLDPEAFERDSRHFLYREYLRILRRYSPPVFVMENVKGLLSSRINGELLINRIVRDLSRKTKYTYGYNLYSFVASPGPKLVPEDFVIRSEEYGIPQNRHRVLLLGIRRDLPQDHRILEKAGYTPTVSDAIRDLPGLRSRLSREEDSLESWQSAVYEAMSPHLTGEYSKTSVGDTIACAVRAAKWTHTGDDAYFADGHRSTASGWFIENKEWFFDEGLGLGVLNHSSRAHMRSDLARYMFAASFGMVYGRSPKLRDFPSSLLPNHRNVYRAMKNDMFNDRFRVQVGCEPATTIVSHIAKDGHYFIHPDPSQCRSLTVREAARLQTFPDNYLFEGPRTEQYRQVGNAVPPLLAVQLASIVHEILLNVER